MSKEAALAQLSGSPGLAEAPAASVAPVQDLESSRFAHLAKKEAAVVAERNRIKAEAETLKKDREAFTEAANKVRLFEETRTKNPIEAIKSLGLSETDILNFLAAAEEQNADPVLNARKAAQDEIKAFQDAQAKKEQEVRDANNKRAIEDFRSQVSKTLQSAPDQYEYCNYNGALAEELIWETVQSCYEEDLKTNPKALPISAKEAADMVEAYYEEQDKAMSSLKKRTPAEAKQEAYQAAAVMQQPVKQPTRTISNKLSPSAASTVNRVETPSQKRERLIRQLGSFDKK